MGSSKPEIQHPKSVNSVESEGWVVDFIDFTSPSFSPVIVLVTVFLISSTKNDESLFRPNLVVGYAWLM